MKWNRKKTKRALFDQCVSDYHGILYKHALWMTGNQALAADMVQETYYQAWSSIDSLQDDAKALAWLLTILRRAVYREQRHHYRHVETVAHLSQIDKESSAPDHYQLLEIYSALEAISVQQRDALLLHNLHGFSYAEISEQLNIPIGTVMSRISRAKAALKQIDKSKIDNIITLPANKRGTSND